MNGVLKICIAIILSTKLVQSLLCDADKDCFAGYPYCCGGFCKKSCNLTCTSSSDCGSLGHLQEKCCNGRCIGINEVCLQKNSQKTRLNSVHIVVLVLCIVVFVAVGSCALASYLCKCGYLYRRRTNMNNSCMQDDSFEPFDGQSAGRQWNYLGKIVTCKTPGHHDGEIPLQSARFSETSWVGKDFVQSRSFYTNKSNEQEMKYQMKMA